MTAQPPYEGPTSVVGGGGRVVPGGQVTGAELLGPRAGGAGARPAAGGGASAPSGAPAPEPGTPPPGPGGAASFSIPPGGVGRAPVRRRASARAAMVADAARGTSPASAISAAASTVRTTVSGRWGVVRSAIQPPIRVPAAPPAT